MKKSIALTIMLTLGAFLNGNAAGKESWKRTTLSNLNLRGTQAIQARAFLSYELDREALQFVFSNAPEESAVSNRTSSLIVELPMPDGTFQEFRVVKTDVMHPDLAVRYPEIVTYGGQGITDPHATAKFDFTPFGFHAMILSPGNTVFIDPFSLQDPDHYMVYYKRDFISGKQFNCGVPENNSLVDFGDDVETGSVSRSIGTELKTYRLAMAATGEYTAVFGGTVAGALAAIVTSVNRVTGVYEREFAIRMVLIANTDTLIFTNAATDPYDNNDGGVMLGQNQTTVTARIGGPNYDIGHVFSTGGGGIAGLGVVCYFALKAQGVTGSPAPYGDPFDIDYVAHEIGHQFGGNHTFNCEVGSCSGNRSFTTAYEPGSGSTIMAYAGICGNNNLQSNSDDYFHTKSFDEIITYTTTGVGNACPVVTSTGNNPPVINPGANYIIPYLTPFRLTGDATDPDGDPVTYCWEQYNLGPAGTWSAPAGNAPIFRSFDPTTNPVRLFPKLNNILNNNQTIGEVKPSYARTLNFKLTARDNRLNGGGVTNNDTTVTVQVINTGQAFAVTSPNVTGITWPANGVETVTWDVGGSDLAPISTPTVNILLSTDGGQTFPITLATGVSNNGSYNVNVPNVSTTTARVMVEGAGNIFFDINDKNFSIAPVGIAENSFENGVFLAPNPANGSVEVILASASPFANSLSTLQLFDMTGRKMLETGISQSRTRLNLQNWSRGCYFFLLQNENGKVVSGKLLVQ